MIYGMGTVFVFLSLLVVVTLLMSSVVNRLAPDDDKETPVAAQPSRSTSPEQLDPHLMNVLQQAVDRYRQS